MLSFLCSFSSFCSGALKVIGVEIGAGGGVMALARPISFSLVVSWFLGEKWSSLLFGV
jgi:hypothetical protein